MLRNCVSGARGHMQNASALMGFLGWGGVGMFTFAELAHLVAATQLRFWCPWTHAGCFGSDGMFGVGWGGVGMFTFAELAHLVAATQLRSRGHMLDASALMGCLGWGGVGMFTFAELAHMVDATQHVS